MTSSILYGCETWWSDSISLFNSTILTSLKVLLGVRTQTCTEAVHIECDIANARAIIQGRQIKFVNKYFANDSILSELIDQATELHTPMANYINKLVKNTQDPSTECLTAFKQKVRSSEKSKLKTYVSINPDLSHHPIYSKHTPVPEFHRVTTTRTRLSSHRLRIETGRWNRTPREERICTCGSIQDERHVLLECVRSAQIRSNYNSLDFSSLYSLFSSF